MWGSGTQYWCVQAEFKHCRSHNRHASWMKGPRSLPLDILLQCVLMRWGERIRGIKERWIEKEPLFRSRCLDSKWFADRKSLLSVVCAFLVGCEIRHSERNRLVRSVHGDVSSHDIWSPGCPRLVSIVMREAVLSGAGIVFCPGRRLWIGKDMGWGLACWLCRSLSSTFWDRHQSLPCISIHMAPAASQSQHLSDPGSPWANNENRVS